MKTLLTIAALAILLAGSVSASELQSSSTAVETYISGANKEVHLYQTLLRYETISEGWKTDLKPEYDAAAAQLKGNADAEQALKSHWIKLHQCLSKGIGARGVAQCKYELSGLEAYVDMAVGGGL